MTGRIGRAILLGLVGALAVVACYFSPAERADGHFWSDGATYYTAAWSLATDGDLRYEAKDVARVRREYPGGPQGIFLKRTSGGLICDTSAGWPWIRSVREDEKRVYFAKAFLYPVAAAPLVWLMGSRGLILTNVLLFGLALGLCFEELRRQMTAGRGLALTLILFGASVTPVYILWYTPEILNVALATAALVAWRRDRPILSAVLFGVLVYSKYPNLLLAIPLGLMPFFEARRGRFLARLGESVRRGLVLGATTLALFAVNTVVTGELNYQGGERKTFYGAQFPFEGRVTLGNSGEWMTANQLGPKVAGVSQGRLQQFLSLLGLSLSDTGVEAEPAAAAGAPRWMQVETATSSEELARAFPKNALYFWIGRNAGAALYFAPLVVSLLVFVIAGPRSTAGWLAVVSLLASQLLYIRVMPDNWYGGSGTLGNRYIISLVPLALLLVPRGREVLVTLIGGALGLVFAGPLLSAPLERSLHGGRHTLLPQFRVAPLELTMLNDLTLFTQMGRKKQPVGDVGDELARRPPDPRSYSLYFPDDSTYRREEAFGGTGFWLRGGTSGEVLLRAWRPVRTLRLTLVGGPEGDRVWFRAGACREAVALGPRLWRSFECAAGASHTYHGTELYRLHFRSTHGATVHDPHERLLGTFVLVELTEP